MIMSAPATRRFDCPSCTQRLAVPRSTPAGRRVRCGRCHRVFDAPGPERRAQSGAALHDLSTAPRELRITERPTEPAPRPIVIPRFGPHDRERVDRVAFDKDVGGRIRRRTEVGFMDTREFLQEIED